MEFRILGPLEVVEDGRPIALDRRLSRALLAYLLLHANEAVPAERLVDQLWGEAAPKTATALAPIRPPAPARCSTTTLWPSLEGTN